jgi:hypothetical protein
MDEEAAARAVYELADDLNEAIREAMRRGLKVTVQSLELAGIDRSYGPQVVCEVAKPFVRAS